MNTTRVLVCSEREFVREAYSKVLAGSCVGMDITIVGNCGSIPECVEMATNSKPDVIVVDIFMEQINFVELIRSFLKLNLEPKPYVIALSDSNRVEDLINSLQAGARAYLTTKYDIRNIIMSIHRVKAGEIIVDPSMSQKLIDWLSQQQSIAQVQDDSRLKLSNREKEVLAMLIKGLANKEIANKLYISERTVKVYVSDILNKLHVENRHQAAIKAVESGILDYATLV